MTFYIDDFKLIESDEFILNFISQQISAWFDIQNLEHIHHYLEMKVKQNCEIKTICLFQEVYIKDLLKQHEMKNCYTVSTSMQEELQIMNTAVKNDKFVNKYQSVVNNLQFLATYTQLDISFAAEFLAHWNHASTK